MFAHPDDESLSCGGMLVQSAALGVPVTVLCLTRGENGPRSSDVSQDGELGDIREAEFECAARVLGLRNSIVRRHPDGSLRAVEPTILEQEVLQAIAVVNPAVVVTFDEDGLYWHPDHLAVHRCTTAAVQQLGANAPALVYVVIPCGVMRAVAERARDITATRTVNASPLRVMGLDVDAFGAEAPRPTHIIDVSGEATRKLAALRCHRSQMAADDPLRIIRPEDAPQLLGIEAFRESPIVPPSALFARLAAATRT